MWQVIFGAVRFVIDVGSGKGQLWFKCANFDRPRFLTTIKSELFNPFPTIVPIVVVLCAYRVRTR
jgi:hypothetical protein